MTNKFYIKSRAFINQIETHDWQPEGTDWSGGEPGPHDPRCDLKKKYVITVKEVR